MSGERSWQVGAVRITRVEETVAALPPHGLLPDARPDALAPHLPWLEKGFVDAEGNFLLSIHGLVVESAGRRILVDTCLGEHVVPGFEMLSAGEASFLGNLGAAGFPRETIDLVLCTHLHFDHVGWNTMRSGDAWVPTFPNARYLFARAEWEHWQTEEKPVHAATLGDAVCPILEAGLADLVETNHRVTEEVWLEPTPGHTPGHVAVRIASEGSQAMITGDLTHHPVQWAEPEWSMPADVDAAQAVETRRRLLAAHADSELLVIGTHYAPPTAGFLRSGTAGHWFDASD